ncbi:MAG: alanine racemase, partial [Lachnospiraceae bacterium]|nr:alanine racemase [Lachnospiraceae bacterium]
MKTEDLEEVILQYETPGYVFDEDRVRKNVREFYGILGKSVQLCYAMKANPFLMEALSKEVNRIEVCSYGEYQICRALSIPAEKLLISGVLKNWGELWNILNECEDRAAYTIESLSQYACISDWATRHGKRISVYLRLTSGNQFGMDEETLCNVVELELERNQLDLRGIHYFSGTQKKMKKIEKELQYLDDFMMNLKKKT